MRKIVSVLSAAVLTLTLCACSSGSSTSSITVAGSTTCLPIAEIAAEGFKEETGIDVLVSGLGSSAGIEAVSAGTADIALAAFFSLNEKGVYNLLSRDGYLAVYSGSETDFEIGAAKAQNEMFLLKASAGNLYQHSTTGVGLVDYLHSSLENNGLAAKLQSEFLSDKVVIKNAYMDSATGELLLETEEKEENDG